jgi:hypothetical protein
MWPGDQRPGAQQYPGGQQYPHPQAYPQQPAPQQWPMAPQPNPYQQPCPPPQQWGAPGGPQQPGGKPPRGPNRALLVAGAVVGALVILGGAVAVGMNLSRDHSDDAGPSPSPSLSLPSRDTAPPSDAATEPGPNASSTLGPGGGVAGPGDDPAKKVKPVVHGWQAVPRPQRLVAFDAPPGWDVNSPEELLGFDDAQGNPTVLMGGSTQYRPKWCGTDERALAGTKGAEGAKSTADAARTAAESWAKAAYVDEYGGGRVLLSGAKPFHDSHGVTGTEYTATVTGVPGKKCASDGVVDAVAVKAPDGKYAVWVLVADTGVHNAVPGATIDRMRGSLRFIKGS